MKRAMRAATADKDMRRAEELYAIQAADPECDMGAEYPEDDAPSEDDCCATDKTLAQKRPERALVDAVQRVFSS